MPAYGISQNTVCVELYASKIVDGKVQKVVVLQQYVGPLVLAGGAGGAR
jgi:hypothetical protein